MILLLCFCQHEKKEKILCGGSGHEICISLNCASLNLFKISCENVQLLRRQFEALRALDESRAHTCEELDRTVHELEKTNSRLQQECRNDATTIKK